MHRDRDRDRIEADVIEKLVDEGYVGSGNGATLSTIKSWVATVDEPLVERIMQELARNAGTGMECVQTSPEVYCVTDVTLAMDHRRDVLTPDKEPDDYYW